MIGRLGWFAASRLAPSCLGRKVIAARHFSLAEHTNQVCNCFHGNSKGELQKSTYPSLLEALNRNLPAKTR